MRDALRDPVLILGIICAGVALAASLTKTVSQKPRVRFLCALAVVGFLILVAQQLTNATLTARGKEQKAAIEKSRDEILSHIKGTVDQTEGIVEDLSRRLTNTPIRELGELLVQPDPSAGEGVEILSWGKGPADL